LPFIQLPTITQRAGDRLRRKKSLKIKPKKDDGDDFGNGGDASVKNQRGVPGHSERNRNEFGLSLCNRVSLSGGHAVDKTNGLPEVTDGFCRSAITIHSRRWRFCIVRANDLVGAIFPVNRASHDLNKSAEA
jgi:hypothetical protein